MSKIQDSQLYKYLMFLKKYSQDYNIKEIFNLSLGYQMGSKEEWISDLNNYIERKLLIMYFGNQFDKLPKNYGTIIYENQNDDKDGIKLFYKLLDEFVAQYEDIRINSSSV